MNKIKFLALALLTLAFAACEKKTGEEGATSILFKTSEISKGVVNEPYSQIIEFKIENGVGTPSISVKGLPAGLEKIDIDGGYAVQIAGVPTTEGTFEFEVEVTNNNVTKSKVYTLTIALTTVEEGDGTQEKPWTVAQAIENQGQAGWIAGYIVGSVKNGVTAYTNTSEVIMQGQGDSSTNVLIADDKDETDPAKCINVKLNDSSSKVPSLRNTVNLLDDVSNLGGLLKLTGNLKANFTNLKGIRDIEAYEYSWAPSNIIFGDALNLATASAFSIVDVTKDAAFPYDNVWSFDSTNGYVKASGYANNVTYASESWLISPEINLAGMTGKKVEFLHTIGPAASLDAPATDFTLWVSTDYVTGAPSTATWVEIPVNELNTTAWRWLTISRDIPEASLAATTRFAFRYQCSASKSATWEVKRFVVK